MKGTMAEFTIKEERKDNKSRTVLVIHDNIIVAKTKYYDVFTNKNYEELFDIVKTFIKNK